MITDYSTGHHPAEGEKTWSTTELQRDFEVLGFAAPYVDVRRKSDGARGTLEFTHRPRVYFGWQAATVVAKPVPREEN